jgi:predicted TIM-barrel fold metal-dependent hydrolase
MESLMNIMEGASRLNEARELDARRPNVPITYRVVDADAHVNPPYAIWTDYLPARFHDMAPRIISEPDADYILFEGRKKKLNIMNAQAGLSAKDMKMEGRISDTRSGGWEPASRLADMDVDGIDAAVMFGGGPLGSSNMELYIESFSAYNRWLADFCSYDPRRFCGVAYLPMRDVDESIKMLREVAAMGFRSVNIPGFPQSVAATSTQGFTGASSSMGAQASALTGDPYGARSYIDPEFDPFWAAAVDLDMTLTMHLGGRIPRFDQKDKFLPDLLMSKFAMAEPVAIMIFGGVFMRHPKLRLAQIESGAGWLAFAANYMDRTWEKQRHWMNNDLAEPPSFYMDQNIYASFIHDRIAIVTRDCPGARNIMWSSDYPHSETTYPNSQAVIKENIGDIPADERHMIICERARKLFSIGN